MKTKTSGVLLPVLFVVCGLVSLAAGVINFTQEERFFATAAQAPGQLTDSVYVSRSQYCPLYDFTTKAGEAEEFVDTAHCVSRPDTSGAVAQVQVYYDPHDPSRTSQVRGWLGSEGSGLITGIIGLIFFVGLALVIYLTPALLKRVRARRLPRLRAG